jgi:hypothetical protein
MLPRVEWTSDGRTWRVLSYGSPVGVATAPGQYVHFPSQTFNNVPSASGYGFRVVLHFDWYVGSTRVGVVEDVFDRAGDYHTVSGVSDGGCWI